MNIHFLVHAQLGVDPYNSTSNYSQKRIASQEAVPEISVGKQPLINPTDAPNTTGWGGSITSRLKALKKLEDTGLISEEEAATKRKEILKNL
jgi:hypothetical protein